MMKKTLFFAGMIATLILGSCEQDNEFETVEQTSEQVTLYASLQSNTRIDFDEQGADGIKLAWSAGDKFTLYSEDDGKWAANFQLGNGEGETIGNFVMVDDEGGNITIGTKYRVVYPATNDNTQTYTQYVNTIEGRTQNGNDDMAHLDGMCYMEHENFTYTIGSDVEFAHKYALLTVKLAAPSSYTVGTHGTPSELIAFNGSRSYNLKLISITAWDANTITAYVMMAPCAATSRNFTFQLLTSNGSVFERTATTAKK